MVGVLIVMEMLAFDVEVDVVTIHSFHRSSIPGLVIDFWESTLSLLVSSCCANKV